MGALKRILFVDDHRSLLNALRNALRPRRDKWEMEFVADGNAALAAMAQKPFDVVVSDLGLPDIDGIRLLDHVRATWPHAGRLMVTAVANPEEVSRAAPVVQQLLPKPFAVPKLELAIEESLRAQDGLKNRLLVELIGGASSLPAVPKIYLELCQATARADCDVEMLASIVTRDVAVASKVMQLASSAYFGQAVPTLEAAVFYLGIELVKALALSAHVFSEGNDDPALPRGLRATEVSDSAVRTVRLAKQMVSGAAAEEASIAGLLRDVGTLLLVDRAPDQIIAAGLRSRRDRRPRAVIERELMGVTHADVSAYVLGLWGLPKRFVNAVASHHDAVLEPKDGATAVALAGHLVDHASGIATELDVTQVERRWLAMLSS